MKNSSNFNIKHHIFPFTKKLKASRIFGKIRNTDQLWSENQRVFWIYFFHSRIRLVELCVVKWISHFFINIKTKFFKSFVTQNNQDRIASIQTNQDRIASLFCINSAFLFCLCFSFHLHEIKCKLCLIIFSSSCAAKKYLSTKKLPH